MEKSDSLGHRISRHRWSTRVITNVASDIENAIQKVSHGDQLVFFYLKSFKSTF